MTPLPSDPLALLLAYDRWATHRFLEACAAITPDQFHQRFELGPGSLHDTAAHLLAAARAWADLLAGREPRPRLDAPGSRHTPEELLTLHESIRTELDEAAAGGPMDEPIAATRGGKTYTFTRGGVLAHVATHGVHHRAQALNMLRSLGMDPLPPSSVLEYMRAQNEPAAGRP